MIRVIIQGDVQEVADLMNNIVEVIKKDKKKISPYKGEWIDNVVLSSHCSLRVKMLPSKGNSVYQRSFSIIEDK